VRISKDAMAGTLESSDLIVKVAPRDIGREVVIISSVMSQFGDQINEVVTDALDKLGLSAGEIVIEDKGALDCTIRARVQAAVLRGAEVDTPDWSAL
jgi:citrate lyase subunit gamma (acyl carrier protein)